MIRRPPRSTLLSLHDALPILKLDLWSSLNGVHVDTLEGRPVPDHNEEHLLYQTMLGAWPVDKREDRKSTRLNSSHSQISYAVFCLKKKKQPAYARMHTTTTAS